jgi:hypothetical protein
LNYPADQREMPFSIILKEILIHKKFKEEMKMESVKPLTIEDLKQYPNDLLMDEIEEMISYIVCVEEDGDKQDALLGILDSMLDIVRERLNKTN